MCLWEYCLEERPQVYLEYREQHGACETRDRISEIAECCFYSWRFANNNLGFDAPFDWEWVPEWFAVCVDVDLLPVVWDTESQARMVMQWLESFNQQNDDVTIPSIRADYKNEIFSHVFEYCFDIKSRTRDGSDVTDQMLREAILDSISKAEEDWIFLNSSRWIPPSER